LTEADALHLRVSDRSTNCPAAMRVGLCNRSTEAHSRKTSQPKNFTAEGSSRSNTSSKAAYAQGQARVSAQLINAETGAHLWAENFEGTADNVFALQDAITRSLAGAIAPKLLLAELERAKRDPDENPRVYLGRGWASLFKWTRVGNAEAVRLLRKAMALDPEFVLAPAAAALCYNFAKSFGCLEGLPGGSAEGARLARQALVLGKDDVIALCAGGFGIAYLDEDLDGAFDAIDRAVAINSATASPWAMRAFLHVFRGEQHSALRDFQQAAELSPRDPRLFAWQTAAAYAHFFEGRYERASALANKTIREQPGYLPALRLAAASAALDDRLDQARKLMERLREIDPLKRCADLATQFPLMRKQDFEKLAQGLERAGLPA
jgi:tetratricopeptide (TPR) repeat protein